MKSVQPPAEAVDSWNRVGAAFTQPGPDPAADPNALQTLGRAFARHCPGSLRAHRPERSVPMVASGAARIRARASQASTNRVATGAGPRRSRSGAR
jgi:hypothetical protein